MRRSRVIPTLIVLGLAAALAAVIVGSAAATPTKTSACTTCHSGAASGTVTAAPSTSTPAAGASYTVAIGIGLTSSGNTGYHIAATDAGGAVTSWAVSGGPGAQTSWTATMTAPATAGTYYYTVWCVKGPASSAGQAKAAAYSITVPAAVVDPVLASLSPSSGPVGATLTISGAGMGTSGKVTVGGVAAPTTGWTPTSITCTLPAGLTVGAKNVVVTPAGAAASNALPFTVTVAQGPTAALASLTPNHGQAGASVVITGADMGTSGTVRFGSALAATTAWSASSITATVPDGLAGGATNVTVTPAGGVTSNPLVFTVDAPPASGDAAAPTTTAGLVPGVWCNDVATVNLTAIDNSGGSGVASIAYRVDGRTPVIVSASSVDVRVGVPPQIGAAGGMAVDGPHTVEYYATDVAGNREPVHALTVNIDTSKPATLAPRAARVRQRRVAALQYEVRDDAPNAGTASVVITVKDKRGKVVKRLQLGSRPVNTPQTARFRCSLRPGTYRFSVGATDAAGNPQATVAAQRLTVR